LQPTTTPRRFLGGKREFDCLWMQRTVTRVGAPSADPSSFFLVVGTFRTFSPSRITRFSHHQTSTGTYRGYLPTTMPKRKRDEAEGSGTGTGDDQGKSLRQRRVEHKLDQGRKLVSRAFKTAKGFERQKLSRRRKTACDKGDAQDVARIDAEIEAIKVCMCVSLPHRLHLASNARCGCV